MPPNTSKLIDLSSDSDMERPQAFDAAPIAIEKMKQIKARRDKSRKANSADFHKRLNDLRGRVKKCLDDRKRKILSAQKQQVRRLLAAVETRDDLQKALALKLRQIQEQGLDLRTRLVAIYDGRRELAEMVSVEKLLARKST
ncbi:hypothetical protein NKR23_g7389 [Pleurostoma richardsiae]|uniref:Uncharacterized protein n=1 Tax=Pleurostoma richardsiae TaxID=41990 RepID=A0AA38VMT0_9PEZI|nr:hypothetical protein NKR23_g7389 [Pleurostoma richardsiae]